MKTLSYSIKAINSIDVRIVQTFHAAIYIFADSVTTNPYKGHQYHLAINHQPHSVMCNRLAKLNITYISVVIYWYCGYYNVAQNAKLSTH